MKNIIGFLSFAIITYFANIDEKGDAIKEKEKILVEKNEQRRAGRLSVAISVALVAGTALISVFNLCIKFINMYPHEGGFFWYFIIFMHLVFAIAVILSYKLLKFLWIELCRHNIRNDRLKELDEKSDGNYETIIYDIKLYGVFLISYLLVVIIIALIAIKHHDEFKAFGLSFISLIVTVIYVQRKNIKVKNIDEVIKKLLAIIFVTCACYLASILVVVRDNSNLQIKYNENGEMSIYNSSSYGFGGASYQIEDVNNEVVFDYNISSKDVLKSLGRTSMFGLFQRDGEELIDLQSEFHDWKYVINLNDIINTDGGYIITVKIYQKGKKFEHINSFVKYDKRFIYCQDIVEKQY